MKTPWHLWVVGLATLVWNCGGAFDYLMTRLGNEAYLAQIPEPMRAEMLAYVAGFPLWASVAWGLGIWGSVLGSVLLLARSRLAVPALWVSMAGLVAMTVYSYALAAAPPAAYRETGAMLFSAAIFVVLVLTLLYALAQIRRGVLR